MINVDNKDYPSLMIAKYHLPGLFEFYELYHIFLPLYKNKREWFYDWCDIGSIYGTPTDCIWGGGRVEEGDAKPEEVLGLLEEYGISARLTFSNSLLTREHLGDKRCNRLCELFEDYGKVTNGVIVYSDILLEYLKDKYKDLYFVSSTTKVLTDFEELRAELNRDEFSYVVPDFRLNKRFNELFGLSVYEKARVEFLCNECCNFECRDRHICYEAVSAKNLGYEKIEHHCKWSGGGEGYRFSKAMDNPGFISIDDIQKIYLREGFKNFKIEGRGLGSAIVLEFLLYYMTKPEYQLRVREEIYLSNTLDLF